MLQKKSEIEFLRLEEIITKKISIDEFVRVMPAGKSQVKDVNSGEADIKKFIDTEEDEKNLYQWIISFHHQKKKILHHKITNGIFANAQPVATR